MRFLLVFPFLLGRAFTARGPDVPPTSVAPSSGKSSAGPTATVTFGPSSNYVPSLSAGVSKPSSDSFTIVPAGNAGSDGIDLILGEDLQKKMDSALKDKCHDAGSNDCTSAIQDLLPLDVAAIERRQAVAAALIADIVQLLRPLFALIIGAVAGVGAGKAVNKVNEAYHAPMSDISQANNPTSASAIAIVTSAKASPTVIQINPSDAPKDEPSIETGTKGGFTIHLSEDLAKRTSDYLGMHSNGGQGCPGVIVKRSLKSQNLKKRVDPPDAHTVGCLAAGTVIVFTAMIRGPLAEWVRLARNPTQVNAPRGAGAAIVLQNVQQQVAPMRQELPAGLFNDDQWRALVGLAYWETHNQIVLHNPPSDVVTVSEQDLEERVCLPKEFVKCSGDHCKGSKGKCADSSDAAGCECTDQEEDDCDDDYQPACLNCGGDKGGGVCRGLPDGTYKDCKCWNEDDIFSDSFASDQELQDAQAFLANLKDVPDNPPPPDDGGGMPAAQCKPKNRKRVDNNLVAMDTDFFTSLAQAACKDFPGDPDKNFDKKLTNKDADPKFANTFAGWTVDFSWEDKPGACGDNCQKIFESFVHSSTECSPNSHSMAPSGEIDIDCGTAKFSITPASSASVSSSSSSSSSKPPDSTTSSASPNPTNCPAKYPTGSSDQDIQKWAAANRCDDKCPPPPSPGKQKFYQTPLGCVCLDEGCIKAGVSHCAC